MLKQPCNWIEPRQYLSSSPQALHSKVRIHLPNVLLSSLGHCSLSQSFSFYFSDDGNRKRLQFGIAMLLLRHVCLIKHHIFKFSCMLVYLIKRHIFRFSCMLVSKSRFPYPVTHTSLLLQGILSCERVLFFPFH